MSKQVLRPTSGAPPLGPYSLGFRAGDFIFTAGQGSLDPATGKVAGESIEEQTARTLENIKMILEAGGATLSDVIKTTVYLTDTSLFNRFNVVYARHFPDPQPARTVVGAQLGHVPGCQVVIEVVAYVGLR